MSNEYEKEIEEAIKSFKDISTLPTRIILYSLATSNAILPILLAHNWQTSLFVQLPHVTSISFEEIKNAFIHSFTDQILSNVPIKQTVIKEEALNERSETENKNEEIKGFVVGEDVLSDSLETDQPKNSLFLPLFSILEKFKSFFKNSQFSTNLKGKKKRHLLLVE